MLNYTKEQLNELLLSRKLSDFYLVLTTEKQPVVTVNQYGQFEVGSALVESQLENRLEKIEEMCSSQLSMNENFQLQLKNIIAKSLSTTETIILVKIDGYFYDIANSKFYDVTKNKIVYYERLTNYYDESTACVFENDEPERELKSVSTVDIRFKFSEHFLNFAENNCNKCSDNDLVIELFHECSDAKHK